MGRKIKKGPVCGMGLALALIVLAAILVNANHSGTFIPAGSMNIARVTHQAVLLTDGHVLVIGGYCPTCSGGGANNPSAELYDPTTDSWSITGSMLIGRVDHTATLLKDGRVLVAGGVNSHYICSSDLSTEIYDPSTETWTRTGDLPLARTGHTATLLEDGRVLLAGGGNRCGGIYRSAALYDPATGMWTPTGLMTQARQFHSAVRLADGRVLVVGGMSLPYPFPAINSAEIYDPVSGTWSPTGSMTIRRTSGGNGGTPYSFLALLEDGRVLAATSLYGDHGHYMWYRSKIAEIFDPSTGVWTTTGSMITARSNLCLARLKDGTVLAAGGHGGEEPPPIPMATAEIYNPVTGTWSLTGPLNALRLNHTSTVMANGRVLIAGGAAGDPPTITATAEIYVGPTPEERIENLIDDIEDMINSGELSQGCGRALISILERALERLNAGNTTAACAQLRGFIRQAESFIRGGLVSEEEGQAMIDAVNEVINEICG